MDNLENDKLDPAKIDDIKDDLDYYVEMNQDEDYVEYDEFYDQLEVADDEEEELEVEGSLAQMAAESFEEEERKRLELQQLGTQQPEATRASQSSASSSTAPPPPRQAKSGSVSSSSDAHSHGQHHANTTTGSVKAEVLANGTVATTTTTTPVKKAKPMNVVPAPPHRSPVLFLIQVRSKLHKQPMLRNQPLRLYQIICPVQTILQRLTMMYLLLKRWRLLLPVHLSKHHPQV